MNIINLYVCSVCIAYASAALLSALRASWNLRRSVGIFLTHHNTHTHTRSHSLTDIGQIIQLRRHRTELPGCLCVRVFARACAEIFVCNPEPHVPATSTLFIVLHIWPIYTDKPTYTHTHNAPKVEQTNAMSEELNQRVTLLGFQTNAVRCARICSEELWRACWRWGKGAVVCVCWFVKYTVSGDAFFRRRTLAKPRSGGGREHSSG